MELVETSDRSLIEDAVMRTVAYGDVFDAPVTIAEIHRYLEVRPATRLEVEQAVDRLVPQRLARVNGLLSLPGREHLAGLRRRREAIAAAMWPRATRAGVAVARLPFVRMVAVTGALAMDNVDQGADIDLLVVTEPGRLWLCRSLIIQLVRLLRLRGVTVCPNWFLSEERLALDHRDLYAARELTQMVPLAGMEVYVRMRRANTWTDGHLPNAAGPPGDRCCSVVRRTIFGLVGEAVLRSSLVEPLERWECRRKVREITRLSTGNPEVVLDRHQCKGHVDGHGRLIAEAYSARLRSLSLSP